MKWCSGRSPLFNKLICINRVCTCRVSQSSFSSRYSQHHKSQTIRAKELTFWENVHPTPCVMCHLSPVTCYLSHVACHMSPVTCHLSSVKCQNKTCLNFLIIVPGGPWGAFMGLVGASLGPQKVLLIVPDLFHKCFWSLPEVVLHYFWNNLLAMPGGPTRGLSRAPRVSKF